MLKAMTVHNSLVEYYLFKIETSNSVQKNNNTMFLCQKLHDIFIHSIKHQPTSNNNKNLVN